MKPPTIVATLTAKPGKGGELLQLLNGLVAPPRAEAGCINYEPHRSREQPGCFVFAGRWASRERWGARMKSPHPVGFGERQGALAESWTLFDGERVT